MSYYQEIRLIPDAEIGMGVIWSKVFSQVHLALADYKNKHKADNLGVSFPEYYHQENSENQNKPSSLGRSIRVFCSENDCLAKLDLKEWLSRLTDYASLSEVLTSDESSTHAVFSRYQPKTQSSMRRSIKRRMEKRGETEEQAVKALGGFYSEESKLPFIHLESLTNGQSFRLFIKKNKASNVSPVNTFTTYGLSKDGSTVPVF